MNITYLKNSEINFVRWDNCINNAINGNIFAYSWYLNIICEDWDALVMDDYEYVMPILHLKKFKRDIIFSSKLGIRLGIFSNKILTENIVKTFVNKIPKKYLAISIILNKFNKLSEKTSNLFTHELDLVQSHLKITEKYSNQFQKNIHIAVSKRISIVQGLTPNDLIHFAEKKESISSPNLRKAEIHKLRMIMAYGLRYNLAEMYGAYTVENNLCAVALFIKSKRKHHLIFNAINKEGLNSFALHYLIDKFIESHAEKTLTLNLENVIFRNDIDFFTGIGAHEYKYKRYYVNRLPWYYKFLLKID